MPYLSYKAFRILLRVTIKQSMIVRVRVIVVCIGSKFLLTQIATHGPYFVVVTRTFLFKSWIILYLELLSADYAFSGVHCQQILTFDAYPFMFIYFATLKNLDNLFIWFKQQ